MRRTGLTIGDVHMIHRMRSVIACCLSVLLIAPLLSAAEAQNQSLGRWLVDRARTYGLTTQNPTLVDGEFMLIWLEAASRLSPNYPDSYLWQYDIHRRMNHPEASLKALEAYCNLVPENTVARLDQIALAYDSLQTAESRMAYCREQLDAADLPPIISSDLHLRMAALYQQSCDDDNAYQEALQAAKLNPLNLAASMMALDLGKDSDKPVERIRLMLSRIAANPARGDSLYTLAQYLDQLGMHREAIPLYQESIDDFRRRNPDLQPPDSVILDLARSYCDAKDYEKALSVCESLLAVNPDSLPASMLIIRIARSGGNTEAEKQAIEKTAKTISALEPEARNRRLPMPLGAMAWFYTEYQPDPSRAVSLAREAYALAPGDPEITCILGLALVANNQAEEAANLLEPLSAANAAAAVGLARAKLVLGYRDAAIDLLRKAEKTRCSGLAYEYAVSILDSLGESPAATPDRSDVRQVLSGFNANLYDFDDHPEKALKFQAGFYQKQFIYGDPMECAFRITNISDYSVTLGPDAMLNPEVLVSVHISGGAQVQFDGYLSVSLYQRHVLKPGESVTVSQSLAVGPLEKFPEYHARNWMRPWTSHLFWIQCEHRGATGIPVCQEWKLFESVPVGRQ